MAKRTAKEHNNGESMGQRDDRGRFTDGHSHGFQPGQSGNPAGRPPNENSITYWLREFSGMTGKQAAKLCKLWAKELEKGGDDLPMAGLVALKTVMSLINEPTPGLLGHALDRIDGSVEQKVKTDGTGTQTIEVVYVNHQDRARGDT